MDQSLLQTENHCIDFTPSNRMMIRQV